MDTAFHTVIVGLARSGRPRLVISLATPNVAFVGPAEPEELSGTWVCGPVIRPGPARSCPRDAVSAAVLALRSIRRFQALDPRDRDHVHDAEPSLTVVPVPTSDADPGGADQDWFQPGMARANARDLSVPVEDLSEAEAPAQIPADAVRAGPHRAGPDRRDAHQPSAFRGRAARRRGSTGCHQGLRRGRRAEIRIRTRRGPTRGGDQSEPGTSSSPPVHTSTRPLSHPGGLRSRVRREPVTLSKSPTRSPATSGRPCT